MALKASCCTAGTMMVLAANLSLAACGEVKPKNSPNTGQARADARRKQEACASASAVDKLKGRLFDQAIGQRHGDRAGLDTLADYSLARVEEPVVAGWDPALDLTRCKGRLILQMPPGAERGFGGNRQLDAQIDYTAQAAADGSGLIYEVHGADPVIAQLAAFNLTPRAYQPPPAIDQPDAVVPAQASQPPAPPSPPEPVKPRVVTTIARSTDKRLTPVSGNSWAAPRSPVERASADHSRPLPRPTMERASAEHSRPSPRPVVEQASAERSRPLPRPPVERASAERSRPSPKPAVERASAERSPPSVPSSGDSAESTIRAFYGALGAGDGAGASTNVIPEKRASGAFSAQAMTNFYGRLREPIRLTDVTVLGDGAYRVRYRYSAGRSHCDGSAVVRTTSRSGRDLIRSIRAQSGC